MANLDVYYVTDSIGSNTYLRNTLYNRVVQQFIYIQKRVRINFGDTITSDHVQSLSRKDLSICLKNFDINDKVLDMDAKMLDEESDIKLEPSKYDVVPSLPQTAEIKAKKGASTWIEISSGSEED